MASTLRLLRSLCGATSLQAELHAEHRTPCSTVKGVLVVLQAATPSSPRRTTEGVGGNIHSPPQPRRCISSELGCDDEAFVSSHDNVTLRYLGCVEDTGTASSPLSSASSLSSSQLMAAPAGPRSPMPAQRSSASCSSSVSLLTTTAAGTSIRDTPTPTPMPTPMRAAYSSPVLVPRVPQASAIMLPIAGISVSETVTDTARVAELTTRRRSSGASSAASTSISRSSVQDTLAVGTVVELTSRRSCASGAASPIASISRSRSSVHDTLAVGRVVELTTPRSSASDAASPTASISRSRSNVQDALARVPELTCSPSPPVSTKLDVLNRQLSSLRPPSSPRPVPRAQCRWHANNPYQFAASYLLAGGGPTGVLGRSSSAASGARPAALVRFPASSRRSSLLPDSDSVSSLSRQSSPHERPDALA